MTEHIDAYNKLAEVMNQRMEPRRYYSPAMACIICPLCHKPVDSIMKVVVDQRTGESNLISECQHCKGQLTT